MVAELIKGNVGNLEVRVTRPGDLLPKNEAKKAYSWVVISHPHPLYGGSMNNKVVTSLEKAFQSLGYGTVIYNFRGVGGSEGEYDNGDGEQQDLVGVVNWLRQAERVDELVLAGFSFGSYITLKQAESLEADAVCVVAPPVSMYDFSGISLSMPWLLIQGGQDEVIDAKEVLDWGMGLEMPPDVYWRHSASHFFHGQLVWLKKIVALNF